VSSGFYELFQGRPEALCGCHLLSSETQKCKIIYLF
jgi:hypothetical protein